MAEGNTEAARWSRFDTYSAFIASFHHFFTSLMSYRSIAMCSAIQMPKEML